MKSKPTLDPEYIGLIHDVYARPIPGHLYRGYAILDGEGQQETEVTIKNSKIYPKTPPNFYSTIKEANANYGSCFPVWEANGLEWREIWCSFPYLQGQSTNATKSSTLEGWIYWK